MLCYKQTDQKTVTCTFKEVKTVYLGGLLKEIGGDSGDILSYFQSLEETVTGT